MFFSFRSTFNRRIINLIHATFVIHYFVHLFLWNEPAVIPKPILGQVLPAVVADVVPVHPLLLFFPVANDFGFPLFNWQHGSIGVSSVVAYGAHSWAHAAFVVVVHWNVAHRICWNWSFTHWKSEFTDFFFVFVVLGAVNADVA